MRYCILIIGKPSYYETYHFPPLLISVISFSFFFFFAKCSITTRGGLPNLERLPQVDNYYASELLVLCGLKKKNFMMAANWAG